MGVTSTEAAACSFCLPTHLQAVLATSQRSVSAPAITLEPMPLALPLTRNRLRRAVCQGASWTAAYHLQLTVAAVARPVRGSVGAPGVLAAERSRLLLAQTASARRSVQPVFERSGVVAMVDPASRHATASAAGVSSMRCPPIRSRCPGSGCPAVRCPVTWGRRPEVRRSAVCCPPIQRPAVCCPPVRCPAVWCLPRPSGRVRLLPCSGGWRWDPGRGGRATVTTGTGGGPGGCRAVDGSIDGQRGRDAGDAAEVALINGRSVADPGRRVGCGPRRPRLPAERPGGPGRRAEPVAAAARWDGSRLQREVAAPAAWLPSSAGCATTVGGRRRA